MEGKNDKKRLFESIKKNVMDAVSVRMPVMKVPLTSLTEKAELVREHFCDGLGDCLPECPTGAISFEEREAPAYDEEAVKEAQKKIAAKNRAIPSHSGCPGSKIMQIRRTETSEPVKATSAADSESKLQNWPVQIKLAPVNAPYF